MPRNTLGISRHDDAGATGVWAAQQVRDRFFGMAGLWERWQAPDGTWLETCTILTGDANELMAPIHDRMPIILVDRAAYDRWLAPEPLAAADLRDLLQPPPAQGFEAYPVSSMVNAPQNDSPACIEPAAPAAQPAARPRPAQRSLFDPD